MKIKKSFLRKMINEEIQFYKIINEELVEPLQEEIHLGSGEGRYLVYFFNQDCPRGKGGGDEVKKYGKDYGPNTVPLKGGKSVGSFDILGSADNPEEFYKMVITREQEILKKYKLEDYAELGDFVYDSFMIIDKETDKMIDPPQNVPFDVSAENSYATCDGPFSPVRKPSPEAIKVDPRSKQRVAAGKEYIKRKPQPSDWGGVDDGNDKDLNNNLGKTKK